MRKWMIVVICIVLVVIAGGAIFMSKMNEMVKYFAAYNLKNIDLQTVADGAYRGSCGKFVVFVELEANIARHRISDIKIISQKCGKGYDGKKVIERVLKDQTLAVDAKTGATGSSKCILIALERALTGQQAK